MGMTLGTYREAVRAITEWCLGRDDLTGFTVRLVPAWNGEAIEVTLVFADRRAGYCYVAAAIEHLRVAGALTWPLERIAAEGRPAGCPLDDRAGLPDWAPIRPPEWHSL